MTIQVKGIVGLAVWFCIGLLVYMLFYAPDVFTWSDPWVYIIGFLWPLALIWEFLVIIFWIVVMVFVGWVLWGAWQHFTGKYKFF